MLKKSWKIDVPIELLVDGKCYTIEGKKFYRVTRVKGIINQPELNNWRVYVGAYKANAIMKKRGSFGTTMHKLIEVSLMDGKLDLSNYNEEMQESMELFYKEREKYNLKAESVEQRVWNDELSVAGTVDFIGFADLKKLGKHAHVIGDWKSSKTIYDDFFLQLAAYVFTFELMTGVKLDGAFILQIRDGVSTIEEKSYDELKCYFELFKHALEIFKYKENGCNSD